MNNTAEIKTDGTNLYITLISKAHPAGKVMLTVLNVLALVAYSMILIALDDQDVKRLFIPGVFLFVMTFFFSGRYWLWHFFGKEHIILNTKAIVYYKDFGLMKGNPKTISYEKMVAEYEFVKVVREENFGRLNFMRYDPETRLAQDICQTGILLPEDQLQAIEAEIEELYEKEFRQSIPFSAN